MLIAAAYFPSEAFKSQTVEELLMHERLDAWMSHLLPNQSLNWKQRLYSSSSAITTEGKTSTHSPLVFLVEWCTCWPRTPTELRWSCVKLFKKEEAGHLYRQPCYPDGRIGRTDFQVADASHQVVNGHWSLCICQMVPWAGEAGAPELCAVISKPGQRDQYSAEKKDPRLRWNAAQHSMLMLQRNL